MSKKDLAASEYPYPAKHRSEVQLPDWDLWQNYHSLQIQYQEFNVEDYGMQHCRDFKNSHFFNSFFLLYCKHELHVFISINFVQKCFQPVLS